MYGFIAIATGVLLFSIWLVALVYTISVYLGNFINDKRSSTDDLKLFKAMGIDLRENGFNDGEDLTNLFGLSTIFIIIFSIAWIITIPAIIVTIVVLYLRDLKRKEKEGN